MQLTPETILSLVASALTGGVMAWLGNRIVQAELWGHIKKHCREIEVVTKRLDAHSDKIDAHGQKLAVLAYLADHP